MSTLEKTLKLFEKMEKNPENKLYYRNLIIEENIKLVPHVLRRYRPYTDDQFQAGCLGLIVAVDTFNPTKEVPFPMYACFCIEREIHKMYKEERRRIENVFAEKMVYLDAPVRIKNDDEALQGDLISDVLAEEEYNRIIEEYDLKKLFKEIIEPCVRAVAQNTKGQATKVNIEDWIKLELLYILDLASIDSQKVRLNYSKMAKHLGLSVQNVRNRHLRVIKLIRKKLTERGYMNV